MASHGLWRCKIAIFCNIALQARSCYSASFQDWMICAKTFMNCSLQFWNRSLKHEVMFGKFYWYTLWNVDLLNFVPRVWGCGRRGGRYLKCRPFKLCSPCVGLWAEGGRGGRGGWRGWRGYNYVRIVSDLLDQSCRNELRHDKTNKVSVPPAKAQISLGIRPIWSESSLSAWRNLRSLAVHWMHSEDWSDWAMPRLIWVFAGRTLILLVLSSHGSNITPINNIVRQKTMISEVPDHRLYQSQKIFQSTEYHHDGTKKHLREKNYSFMFNI